MKGKGSMNTATGMCSYKSNPMSAATRTKPECGPGMNADQKKANALLQQSLKKHESLRGMSGM